LIRIFNSYGYDVSRLPDLLQGDIPASSEQSGDREVRSWLPWYVARCGEATTLEGC
jgi:hypothetical protein